MSIPISGTLYDPFGNVARFADIKFVTLQGFGDVIESSSAVYRTDENGAYSIDVQLGRYAVYMRFNGNNGAYDKIQAITVNSDVVASTLGELLEYTEPLTPAEILIVQQLAAEAVAAKDDAQAAALQAAIDESLAAASASSAQASATAASNSVALLAPVAVNGGVWASGQQFTAYNQYMIYSGEAYSPLPATSLPYTVGATPNLSFVYQIVLNDHSRLANRNATGAHDAIYRRETTTPEITANNFDVGTTLTVKDRGSQTFIVENGTADGVWSIATANGKVASILVDNNTITSDSLGITSGMDATSILTTIAPKIESNAITQIVMNVDASFTGTLPFEYNRVAFAANKLTGVGRLAIDTQDNIIQALPNTHSPYKTYSGNLNGMLLDNQNVKSAIEVRKEIRVVLLGDSIGVTADWDSQAVPSGARDTQGVDNFSTVNSLGFLMFQEICAAAGPNVRVKFYSRCVGGKSYINLGAAWDSAALNADWTGREQCTAGKAWVDCVLDLEPDLVIHEMGMNHGAFDYYNGFYDNWYLKLVGTGRVGTFDQALITTPSPNFEDAGAFGDFRPFCTPMFFVAAQQRYVANKFGMTLIDVSFNSFLKRYGVDPRTSVISKNSVDVLTSASLSAGVTQSFQHPNKPIYHQTTFTINQNAGANLDFRINYGGVLVQFTKTDIAIYTGFFTSQTNVKQTAYAMPDGTSKTFTIQVLPHGIFVFDGANGATLLLTSDLTSYQNTVDMALQNSSSSGTVNITNVKVFEGEFPRYASDTSTIEMYGELNYLNNPFGGGINHPSNKGLAEIYIPPFREYCTRLTEGNKGQYVNNQIDMSNGDLIYLGSMELLPYSVNEFRDDTALTYLKVKVSSVGAISSIDNRTGMTVWYNSRGDFYAEISSGKNVRGMHYKGNWRKFGGHVVNSANKPLRLTGFTSAPASLSTTFEIVGNGIITRYDVATITSGTTYNFPLDFGSNVFVEATATISAVSANPVSSPVLTKLADTVQVTSSNSGKLYYACEFATSASVTNRRIMFKSTYLLA